MTASMGQPTTKELVRAIADGLEATLGGIVEGAKEDLQVYALEIAAAWTDAIYVPQIKPELAAQERLLAEKYRVLLSNEAAARLGIIRDVIISVGSGLIGRL